MVSLSQQPGMPPPYEQGQHTMQNEQVDNKRYHLEQNETLERAVNVNAKI